MEGVGICIKGLMQNVGGPRRKTDVVDRQ